MLWIYEVRYVIGVRFLRHSVVCNSDCVGQSNVVWMYRAYMQLINKVADIHRVYHDEDNRVQDRMDVRYDSCFCLILSSMTNETCLHWEMLGYICPLLDCWKLWAFSTVVVFKLASYCLQLAFCVVKKFCCFYITCTILLLM